MARYDVYRVEGSLVVDVQTDYLTGIVTRLVVPLMPIHTALRRTPRLNPIVVVEGERYILMTQEMVSIPTKSLAGRVGSMSPFADEIAEAIDVLLTGF